MEFALNLGPFAMVAMADEDEEFRGVLCGVGGSGYGDMKERLMKRREKERENLQIFFLVDGTCDTTPPFGSRTCGTVIGNAIQTVRGVLQARNPRRARARVGRRSSIDFFEAFGCLVLASVASMIANKAVYCIRPQSNK